MSNFSDHNIRTTEKRERERQHRDAIGKYFLDLSKLTFAAWVLGAISPLLTNATIAVVYFYVMAVGVLSTFILAYIGHYILK